MKITSTNICLLYVENNSNQQELLSNVLSRKIDNIILASTREEGFEKFLEHTPDIVMIAFDSSEISGLKIAEDILNINKTTPIILLIKDMQQLEKAFELGIDHYILEPVQESILLEKIDKISTALEYENTIKIQNKKIKNYLNFIEQKLTNSEEKKQKEENKEENTTEVNNNASTNDICFTQLQRIASIGLWKHDHISKELYWSDELYQLFDGLSKKQSPSYEAYLSLICPNEREKVNSLHQNSLNEHKNFCINYHIILKDGTEKLVNEKFETVFDSNDEPLYSVGTIQDINNYKKLYEDLSQNQEIMIAQSKYATMGEMIGMIMHQWRQPITTISMSANNLIADIELDMLETPIVKKSAFTITEQTEYLSKTIDDFRSFFKSVKQIEDVTLKHVFAETSKVILMSLKSKGIEFKLDFDENITIRTYARELIQVLINIIKNAKDALDENKIENKLIEVSVNDYDENIEILICDNAGGIKEEVITKIFDAYFTTKDEKTGTGLGLYMSKTIVEKHLKGVLSVENINNGVKFSINLPKTLLEKE